MTRHKRSEETVRKLLDTALEIYPDDFTLRALTTRSGVSMGSVYHHFGSLEGLAAALYSRCMGALLDTLVAAVQDAADARDGVRRAVTAYLGFTAGHADQARFIHAAPYAIDLGPYAERIAADKAPRLEWLNAWIQRHMDAGTVARLPAAQVEMLLIGPVAEVTRRWLAGAPEIDLDEAARVLPERVWRSLSA
ncbi:Transcriptional regulator, TetR family [[Actinomadura] parvosata subsp. kistnae]|uniref:TetR family transcriptional regulator n=1 Tax=[Actinomadura] parvosata subsp. kistnae TaxID=1909395 RepID=A0A1U9ZTZ7_9ACTN|nr:TetR/AcrR family transcriptional regulator [Nonomuraea sp. ATCC 55076]AQZ61425.1 TetR family transcriptional regulator [Nonomuraea sp. ATCC 55076]SPL98116.1 Transcriptional regulator, TetR family [Actinomadura parvosata subsp. kistnae]